MKKYIPHIISIVLLVILVLVLKITLSDTGNTEIVKTNDDTTSVSFEKNSFCFKQKQSILEEIKEIQGEHWNEILIEVFYSPQFDSCLYVSEVINKIGTSMKRLVDYRNVAGTNPISSCVYVHDQFTYEDYTSELIQSFNSNGCDVFDSKIKDLKNGDMNVILSEVI